MQRVKHANGAPVPRAKLPEGFSFDLADALTSDIKFLTDFFQRMLALAADAEASGNGRA